MTKECDSYAITGDPTSGPCAHPARYQTAGDEVLDYCACHYGEPCDASECDTPARTIGHTDGLTITHPERTQTVEQPQLAGTCPAVGALVIDGHRRGWLRCSLEAGHDRPRAGRPCPFCDELHEAEQPGTPHRAVFEWSDDTALLDDWPEMYDPNEQPDVSVKLVTPGPCLEPCGVCGESLCSQPLGHDGPHYWQHTLATA